LTVLEESTIKKWGFKRREREHLKRKLYFIRELEEIYSRAQQDNPKQKRVSGYRKLFFIYYVK